MPTKEPKSSRICAPFVTPWVPTVLVQSSAELAAELLHPQTASLTRKYFDKLGEKKGWLA